jgi:recombination protein RecA
MAIDKERNKAIDAAIATIERAFGKGSIMRIGEAEVPRVSVISTGSIGLDLALGVGGIPRGRVIEIFGQESSGKTTMALHIIAEAQRAGGVAAFIDAEHALDVHYARALGVNIDELLVSQPDTGEQALEIAETLVRSGAISVVVVDSVAALVPKAELQGDIGDSQPGAQARLMSQALRMLTGSIHKSDSVVVFINQTREKIGVMFGSPRTTSGGQALKFYASIRMEIIRIGGIKRAEEVLGNRTKVKVVKNKVAPPFREVEFDIYYGKGVDAASEILDMGVEAGIVRKSGAWYAIEDTRIGQGREQARAWLYEHPDVMASLRVQILARATPAALTKRSASSSDDVSLVSETAEA